MLSGNEFVKQSLALHLFYGRIMKEHSFFLEAGFTAKDYILINQADYFRKSFDALLADAIALSNGVVANDVLQSGEVITPYTLKAETMTIELTGVSLATDLTQKESTLAGDGMSANPALEQQVTYLNNKVITLTNALIQFKTSLLTSVLSCRLYTTNYPLLIDHILREAKLYSSLVQKLQSREEIHTEKDAYEQEVFWNRIMAEHAKFIRGLLDPQETDLFSKANGFGIEFDQLTNQARMAMDKASFKKATSDSIAATMQIRDFKLAGTRGLLDCKIKSIIIPLLSDHVLREANHFLRLLKKFQKE
ncbi:MAG: DUF2935 domain-containing protein [Clostridiales bacterium]|nr:DUF2935 domain-containing protein [Clostridiales bacterium]